MKTELVRISKDLNKEDLENIKRAGEILKSGGLVSFPTETVYGLGANGLDETAVKKIYKAKGRPSDNPLILHISSIDQLDELAEDVSPEARRAIDTFWPGPITFIFKKKSTIPDLITGGLDTVAVRMPDHDLARQILDAAGVAIAAPSANTSGRPSPTRAQHVMDDLAGKIDMIVDGGSSGIGIESTVVDLSGDTPLVLRPGKITIEEIRKILANVEEDKSIIKQDIVPKSPGQKYRHYAPSGEMVLFTGSIDSIIKEMSKRSKEDFKKGKKVAILATDETIDSYDLDEKIVIKSLGSREDEDTIAANLFSSLRELDSLGIEKIYAEGTGYDDLGLAIMNRMIKAADGNIVKL